MATKKKKMKLPPAPKTAPIYNENVPSIEIQKEVGRKVLAKAKPIKNEKIVTEAKPEVVAEPTEQIVEQPMITETPVVGTKKPYKNAPLWAYWVFLPLAFIMFVSLVIFLILSAGLAGAAN